MGSVGSGSLYLKMVKFMPFVFFFDVTTFFSDKTCGKHLFEILEVKESFPTFLLLSFWKTAHFLSDFS